MSLVLAVFLIPGAVRGTREAFNSSLTQVSVRPPDELPGVLGRALLDGLSAVMPLFGLLWVAALAGTLAQVGFILTSKPLKPKFERLSPVKNLARLAGIRGVVELLKQVAKAGVVVLLGYAVVRSLGFDLMGQSGSDLETGLKSAGSSISGLLRNIAVALWVLSVGDYVFAKVMLERDLRMTKQEIRDELRQSEGDPLIKSRLRALSREAARRRMLASVQEATAVIVNPTHIAVAIRYRHGIDSAPTVLAVGRGYVAQKIRDTASQSRVPVVRAVPLARALERSCQPGDTLPIPLYEAVAKVLAFIAKAGLGYSWSDVLDLPDSYKTEIPDLKRRKRRR
jgi:flagellar biosynthesis protein FlhB